MLSHLCIPLLYVEMGLLTDITERRNKTKATQNEGQKEGLEGVPETSTGRRMKYRERGEKE